MRFYLPQKFRLRGARVGRGVLLSLENPEVPKEENSFYCFSHHFSSISNQTLPTSIDISDKENL